MRIDLTQGPARFVKRFLRGAQWLNGGTAMKSCPDAKSVFEPPQIQGRASGSAILVLILGDG